MTEVEDLNPHWRWNWRKKKKHVRNRSNAIESSGYFEACNFHPCRVDNIYPYRSSSPCSLYESYVDGTSLVDPQRGGNCSMYHCAPIPLTKAEAEERANFWKSNGELEYLKRYVYLDLTPEQEQSLTEHYKQALGTDLIKE